MFYNCELNMISNLPGICGGIHFWENQPRVHTFEIIVNVVINDIKRMS